MGIQSNHAFPAPRLSGSSLTFSAFQVKMHDSGMVPKKKVKTKN